MQRVVSFCSRLEAFNLLASLFFLFPLGTLLPIIGGTADLRVAIPYEQRRPDDDAGKAQKKSQRASIITIAKLPPLNRLHIKIEQQPTHCCR
jgi:hypothetical protein